MSRSRQGTKMKLENAKVRLPETQTQIRAATKRVSLFMEKQREEISWLDVGQLIPYRHQARKTFDNQELDNLAHSIKSHGIRQPLTVLPCPEKENTFEVVSGERRLRAAIIAGIRLIPCIIIYDEKKAEEIAIVENVHRKDLSPLELGKAYERLLTSGICSSKKEISERLGIPRTKVIDCMNLCELPQEVQTLIAERSINNRDFLRSVYQSSNTQEMIKKINKHYPTLSTDNPDQNNGSQKIKRKKFILQFYVDSGQVNVIQDRVSKLNPSQKIKLVEQLRSLINMLE